MAQIMGCCWKMCKIFHEVVMWHKYGIFNVDYQIIAIRQWKSFDNLLALGKDAGKSGTFLTRRPVRVVIVRIRSGFTTAN